jgi:predicted nucleic acid-binding protein
MILDTSVLIDIDRGVERDKVERLDSEGPHIISSVARAEFFTGVNKRRDTDEEAARKILDIAREASFEGKIAEKAGELIARKHTEELSIGLNDIYIAATAIHRDEKVLTKDTEDFEQIEEVEVENWKSF